jgi:hypothetical protein
MQKSMNRHWTVLQEKPTPIVVGMIADCLDWPARLTKTSCQQSESKPTEICYKRDQSVAVASDTARNKKEKCG